MLDFTVPTCKLVQGKDFDFEVWKVKRLIGLKVHEDGDNGACDV